MLTGSVSLLFLVYIFQGMKCIKAALVESRSGGDCQVSPD